MTRTPEQTAAEQKPLLVHPLDAGNFFILPDEVFHLRLGHGTITVCVYRLCREDRRPYQCYPSYTTIAVVTGLAVNTVMKHINKLSER